MSRFQGVLLTVYPNSTGTAYIFSSDHPPSSIEGICDIFISKNRAKLLMTRKIGTMFALIVFGNRLKIQRL